VLLVDQNRISLEEAVAAEERQVEQELPVKLFHNQVTHHLMD
jgi:hypothetical protein